MTYRLPAGFNLKIIDLDDNGKEILNPIKYEGTYVEVGSRADPIGAYRLITFRPKIQADSKENIRVMVIGEMQYDDPQKNELVGAYIDFTMHP